jgi:hypothetical protein
MHGFWSGPARIWSEPANAFLEGANPIADHVVNIECEEKSHLGFSLLRSHQFAPHHIKGLLRSKPSNPFAVSGKLLLDYFGTAFTG